MELIHFLEYCGVQGEGKGGTGMYTHPETIAHPVGDVRVQKKRASPPVTPISK